MECTRRWSRRTWRPALLPVAAVAVVLTLAGLTAATAGAKTLGQWTDADVGVSVQNGVNYLFTQIDPSGHWLAADDSPDVAQTAFAIAAVGSALSQAQATLNPTQQSQLDGAIQYLIAQQDTSGTPPSDGLFDPTSFTTNYETSLALVALSFFPSAPGSSAAIARARTRQIALQNASFNSNCTPPSGTDYGNCGSWQYEPTCCGGDASNTGFGITGLDFSGGVPAPNAAENANWATATQELASNPYGSGRYNDGCGSYQPDGSGGDFKANANDTGTILFSFAYDGVAIGDPRVAAAMACGNAILDTYEMNQSVTRTMIYHAPTTPPFNLDAACVIGSLGCNWQNGGDGGYHYSLFALSKGFGSYITANIADTSNFYAKVVDLLLSEQVGDGSWPADLRDDGSTIGATSFAILALTKAGQTQAHPPVPPAPPAAPPPKKPAPKVGVAGVRRACASKAFSISLNVATSSSLAVKRVTVKLDGKKVRTTAKSKFRLKVNTKRLKAGRHRLTITAVDAAGGVTTIHRTFSVCKAVAPKRRAAPRFTG
jgi:Bacterial Ig domain